MRTAFVDMLLELNFEKYSPFVLNEGRNKVFFLVMLKSLNGMLQSEFYFYTKFKKEIVQISSFVNLYDPCMVNRMVNGCQHSITWHVDVPGTLKLDLIKFVTKMLEDFPVKMPGVTKCLWNEKVIKLSKS
jgi:hypothetical protein